MKKVGKFHGIDVYEDPNVPKNMLYFVNNNEIKSPKGLLMSNNTKDGLKFLFWGFVFVSVLAGFMALADATRPLPKPDCTNWSKAAWDAGKAPKSCYELTPPQKEIQP